MPITLTRFPVAHNTAQLLELIPPGVWTPAHVHYVIRDGAWVAELAELFGHVQVAVRDARDRP